MLVRFLRQWRMYQPGEIASFDDVVTRDLIALGIAAEQVAEKPGKKAPETK